jgi:UDP-3-O-[3-hydroxymyristoyl] N-acetylglucosamine deacetylase/3-hydroxyacyl-[acyl-carrier-protein] dehydratase
MSRRTVDTRVELSGVGLHLGRECHLAFLPGTPGSGIRFRRIDLPGRPETAALVDHARETERRTQLGDGEEALHTVEHVLAAVMGAGIDDVMIEMDAAEPPILDGSAAPFLEALLTAGAKEQKGEVLDIRLRAPLRVVSGESIYLVEPANALEVDVTIDFPHPLVGVQRGHWTITAPVFANELASARTFGFFHEVESLRAKGLIQGASTSNALALDANGVVGNTLRWPDEFVRHKALDVVGDLALAGRRVRGRITATKPSHRGTVTLVREMLAQSRREGQLENRVIEVEELMKILPHRYPFLLVDRILQIEDGKRIVGIKNVTINEPFFQGHFPGHPIMPGVLIVEAMAQVACPLLMGTVDDYASKVVYFMSLDNVKFRKPVRPGDQLRFELEMTKVRGRICQMAGVAKVDGAVVCEAEMSAMVRDR